MVCGQVGSGKSSLLLACLGEMYKISATGSLTIGGRVAFVGEEAWVLRGSVRENILFGLPYDEARYQMVNI